MSPTNQSEQSGTASRSPGTPQTKSPRLSTSPQQPLQQTAFPTSARGKPLKLTLTLTSCTNLIAAILRLPSPSSTISISTTMGRQSFSPQWHTWNPLSCPSKQVSRYMWHFASSCRQSSGFCAASEDILVLGSIISRKLKQCHLSRGAVACIIGSQICIRVDVGNGVDNVVSKSVNGGPSISSSLRANTSFTPARSRFPLRRLAGCESAHFRISRISCGRPPSPDSVSKAPVFTA